jgi:hypothetical protein
MGLKIFETNDRSVVKWVMKKTRVFIHHFFLDLCRVLL